MMFLPNHGGIFLIYLIILKLAFFLFFYLNTNYTGEYESNLGPHVQE